MPLEVIGAGYGRTGNSSLKEALEILGFPCYQREVGEEHPDDALWLALAKGNSNQVNFDSIFDKAYTAAIDWPVARFYQELSRKYPNAKVILTVRDPDMWYQSMYDTTYSEILRLQEQHRLNKKSWSRKLSSLVNPNKDAHLKMLESVILNGEFHGNFSDKESAILTYNEHIEEVKQFVVPGQLLIYNVKEGWKPLCSFLGVPVPAVPFPLSDPTDEIPAKPKKKVALQRFVKYAIEATTLVGVVAGLGFFLFRHHAAIFRALKR